MEEGHPSQAWVVGGVEEEEAFLMFFGSIKTRSAKTFDPATIQASTLLRDVIEENSVRKVGYMQSPVS